MIVVVVTHLAAFAIGFVVAIAIMFAIAWVMHKAEQIEAEELRRDLYWNDDNEPTGI